MRAVLLRGHGGFEQLEYREDVRVPVPKSGEVLIRIGAAAVNNTDINTRVGWYSKAVAGGPGSSGDTTRVTEGAWTGVAIRFPRIQGADACGRIVDVGPGVDPARIGERVIVDPVLRSNDEDGVSAGYFGSERDGAFADFATVAAANAWKIDSQLTDVELASFPCSCAAAENMLARAQVHSGEKVLITGASGGVGSAAVRLAKRRGAHVTALASASKASVLSSLGASHVFGRDADLPTELGAESVDVVVDVVGGQSFPQLLEILRRGGRYAVAGAIAGPIVDLDLRTLYLKDLQFLGCTVFTPEVFRDLVGYIERNEIRPLVSATYAMSDIVAAQRDFLTKRRAGKIVLTP